jgi:DNA polymerase I-like protein with 3'-5' exonuclease and polymerase domains
MKVSAILLDKWTVRDGPYTLRDIKKVGDFHDEAQAEVRKDEKIIELYSDCAVKSIVKAGQFLKLRCPLDADVKVGRNWAETH